MKTTILLLALALTLAGCQAATPAPPADQTAQTSYSVYQRGGDDPSKFYATEQGLFCEDSRGSRMILESQEDGVTYRFQLSDGERLFFRAESEQGGNMYAYAYASGSVTDFRSDLTANTWTQTEEAYYLFGDSGAILLRGDSLTQLCDMPRASGVKPAAFGGCAVYVTKRGEIILVEGDESRDLSGGFSSGVWAFATELKGWQNGALTLTNVQLSDQSMGGKGAGHIYTYELSAGGLICVKYEIEAEPSVLEVNMQYEKCDTYEQFVEHMLSKRNAEIADGWFPSKTANGETE